MKQNTSNRVISSDLKSRAQLPSDDALSLSSSISLEEYLLTPLSDLCHKIPNFDYPPLVVSHTESIASVLQSLHERRSRGAVVANHIYKWGVRCHCDVRDTCPKGTEVVVKRKMFYSLRIRYSFFDVRVRHCF